MNIEIVEFYEDMRNDAKQILTGTLHVYLIDEEIDLRGVYVSKRKNYWYIGFPQKVGFDPDIEENVRYPVFSFTNAEKNKQLLNEIVTKGREYIEKNVLSKPQTEKIRNRTPELQASK